VTLEGDQVSMRRTTTRLTLAAVALSAACHLEPPPGPPVPRPDLGQLAPSRPADSSALVQRNAEAQVLDSFPAVVARRTQGLADQILLARNAYLTAEISAGLREELGTIVQFEVASDRLRPAGRTALDRKAVILTANPNVRLRLVGAADRRGSARYNLALGERRARAVKHYLITRGVDATRLDVTSAGETAPLDAGQTETSWARNRRVEFVIVSGDSPLALREAGWQR
jgi:outer membrane protein OmpA-like peptidoglycan-associated protein